MSILDCKKCPLNLTRTQVVKGQGNKNTDIMFIGEAPGKNEDLEGIPFCGAAGNFLNELLKSIDLKREEVYITNIVKCRPPQNRDPTNEEKKICSKYLLAEIYYIKPKLIVTLGRHSMYFFLGENTKISQVHGKFFNIEKKINNEIFKINLLPLYHPAVALYNASLKDTLKKDFFAIKDFLTKNKII